MEGLATDYTDFADFLFGVWMVGFEEGKPLMARIFTNRGSCLLRITNEIDDEG